MKKTLLLIVLTFSTFTSFADVYKEWIKAGDGFYITRGVIEGDGFGRANISHLPADARWGGEPIIAMGFSFNTGHEYTQCKSSPEYFEPRKKVLIVEGKNVEFNVSCIILARFSPTNVSVELHYVANSARGTRYLSDLFFKSDFVTLNGFKFSAKGFTKMVNEYKDFKNI